MSKIITLKKSDYHRVVLTDVLPYELPFIFTNEGFYHQIKNKKINSFISKYILTGKEKKPYEYLVKKDKDSNRKLYLIHPQSQVSFVELYRKYSSLIAHLCSRSTYSLRSASSIASIYYDRNNGSSFSSYKDEGVEVDEHAQPKYASSFFTYKKYNFLYKFYDSYEFHKIEKSFHSLFKFDISKCFDSISTDMLLWALRTEDVSKIAKKHYNFESEFIEAIQNANYGRGHGIVIGPEFSRIFAEILLQSIDIKVKDSLKRKNIISGKDYQLRRYVDDYFLFFNESSIKDDIFKIVKEHLSQFKLYCNESKSHTISVPLITPVTSAKIAIQSEMSSLFELIELEKNLTVDDGSDEETPCHNKRFIKSLNKFDLIANRHIRNIKCIVKTAGVDYSSITGYFFTLIKIKLIDLKKETSNVKLDNTKESLCRFFLIILELAFFIYSMDMRVRSTFLISQIMLVIHDISNNHFTNEQSERISKKINDEARAIINYFLKNRPAFNLEILNLIIALKHIDPNGFILRHNFDELLGLTNDTAGYFELMIGLYYIGNNNEYSKSKQNIENAILKLLDEKNISVSSEASHVFLDSLSCPYLTTEFKSKIIQSTCLKQNDFTSNRMQLLKEIGSHNWFIDWDDSPRIIERLLHKKELRAPYGN